MKFLKIALAVFCSAFIGATVAIEFDWHWLIGSAIGGLFGLLMYVSIPLVHKAGTYKLGIPAILRYLQYGDFKTSIRHYVNNLTIMLVSFGVMATTFLYIIVKIIHSGNNSHYTFNEFLFSAFISMILIIIIGYTLTYFMVKSDRYIYRKMLRLTQEETTQSIFRFHFITLPWRLLRDIGITMKAFFYTFPLFVLNAIIKPICKFIFITLPRNEVFRVLTNSIILNFYTFIPFYILLNYFESDTGMFISQVLNNGNIIFYLFMSFFIWYLIIMLSTIPDDKYFYPKIQECIIQENWIQENRIYDYDNESNLINIDVLFFFIILAPYKTLKLYLRIFLFLAPRGPLWFARLFVGATAAAYIGGFIGLYHFGNWIGPWLVSIHRDGKIISLIYSALGAGLGVLLGNAIIGASIGLATGLLMYAHAQKVAKVT